jgi:hypothetical protein
LVGVWPVLSSLLVVENRLAPLEPRQFPFLPYYIPSYWIPILIVLSFNLFITLRPAVLFGLLFGFVLTIPLVYYPVLTRELFIFVESLSLISFWRARPNFVCLSSAGHQEGIFIPYDADKYKKYKENQDKQIVHNSSASEPESLLNGQEENIPSLSSPSAFERRLIQIQELGFSRSKALLGLRISDGSVEGALEELMKLEEEEKKKLTENNQ